MKRSTNQIPELVDQIRPILAFKPPQVQSGVLADLTALWLAGVWIKDEPAQTRLLRAELLDLYLELVKQLTEVNARMLGTDH